MTAKADVHASAAPVDVSTSIEARIGVDPSRLRVPMTTSERSRSAIAMAIQSGPSAYETAMAS